MSSRPHFNPIERDTVQENAYQQLREALMSGRLEPGKRISIRNMASAMNISPMPVREALRRLEAQRALVLRPGRVLAVPEMTREEFSELREIRISLEGLAAERAAERAKPKTLEKLERLCAEMEETATNNQGTAYLEKNRAFHFTLYAASDWDLLVGMIENLWLRTGPVFSMYVGDSGGVKISMAHHWRALKALQQGDGATARDAIAADIRDAADGLLRELPEGDDTLLVAGALNGRAQTE